jgi:D-sedoheptulose 7-phosphate isomerase
MEKKNYRNQLITLYRGSGGAEAYLRRYSNYMNGILSRLDYGAIKKVADYFLSARSRGATIFFLGNGGSAATASHFAQDLGEVGRKAKTKAFRTLCINESIPFMTALANDYGYDKVFTGQISNLFKKGDVLVAISASGNSPNAVEAVKLAKKLKGTTVGLVGFDGGKLSRLCDCIVHVDTNKGEYGPVEDVHLIVDHMITSYLMMRDIGY